MADVDKNRGMTVPNQAPPQRPPFDFARAVVMFLAGAMALSVLASLVVPAGERPGGGTASATQEAKVFEGRRYKYKLHTPAGAAWRPLPGMLLSRQTQGADLGIVHANSDTAVLVFANEMAQPVTLESVVDGIAGGKDGNGFEEVERATVEKGTEYGLFVHARRKADDQKVEVYLFAMIRDDVLFMVVATTPMPVTDTMAAELTKIVKDFEPPPPEELTEPPPPPFQVKEPEPPSTALLAPQLRDAPAEVLAALGNRAVSEGRYQEGATLLHLSLSKGGKRVQYNLACAEAQNGRAQAAVYWLLRAAQEEGVDAAWAQEDSDLADLRRDQRWPQIGSYLRKVQRYWAKHPIENQVLTVPAGYAPGKPIPLIVALHGVGSSPEGFSGEVFQKAADGLSTAILSVSGTETLGPQKFAWAENVERDNARIEKAISAVKDRVTVEGGKIVLIGFSQGAQMATEIAARHPERYAGAIAMSPGTRSNLSLDNVAAGSLVNHRFVVVVGAGESPRSVKTASDDATKLKASGADVYHYEYPGMNAHTFPPDFEKALPKWTQFILEGKAISAGDRLGF